jgi:hypothetical protein
MLRAKMQPDYLLVSPGCAAGMASRGHAGASLYLCRFLRAFVVGHIPSFPRLLAVFNQERAAPAFDHDRGAARSLHGRGNWMLPSFDRSQHITEGIERTCGQVLDEVVRNGGVR